MVANLFFIDYEATGHNPYFDTITEVAIKKIFTDDYYQSLVIPDENGIYYKYVSNKIIELTGITNEMIEKDGINRDISLFNTIEYIKKNSSMGPIFLIAHNGNNFDFILLKKMISEYKGGNILDINIINRIRYIDTLNLARAYLYHEKCNQPGLCKKYQINNVDQHRAYGDILALEKLYQIMCEQFSYFKKKCKTYYLYQPDKLIQDLFI